MRFLLLVLVVLNLGSQAQQEEDGGNQQAERVSRIHPGIDAFLLENVCLTGSTTPQTLVFTDFPDDLSLFHDTSSARASAMNLVYSIQRVPAAQWKSHLSAGSMHNDEDVLLLPDSQSPAHCLHDFAFSIFAQSETGLEFDSYVSMSSAGDACDETRWCCFLFQRLNVVNLSKPARYISTKPNCYARLWITVFGQSRFATDWAKVHDKYKEPSFYADGPGRYPLQNLQNLHSRLLAHNDITRKRDLNYSPRGMLVLDRADESSHVWANSGEFVSMIESRRSGIHPKSIGSLHYFGSTFSSLTPIEQARLFHFSSVIISPQSNHLANIIFGQSRQTVLILVGCSGEPGGRRLRRGLIVVWWREFSRTSANKDFHVQYSESCLSRNI